MASWLDDLGLNELEHIKDGASAFAQELHPINSAEDFISFVVALNLYCRRRWWRMTSRLTRRITSTQPHSGPTSAPLLSHSPPPPHSDE